MLCNYNNIEILINMNGYTVNYLYYEESKRSIITIPRSIIKAEDMNWEHKSEIKILVKEIDGQKGLFLFKKEKDQKET